LGFIEGTQSDNIVATAKHFPGHGYVQGDTHKQTVYIDGELKEIDVYKPLIEAGVISIMIAHVTVENNDKYGTNGLPSTCSPVIVSGLLRRELGFDGIIVTDAMNMMAAVNSGESAPLKAALAGCDMILMPTSEKGLLEELVNAQQNNEEVKAQFDASVKRILKLKLCLNLID
jgi:beta-N-acetylhexosaminidase